MSNLAGATIKSMAMWERVEDDLYPTPPEGTEAMMRWLRSKFGRYKGSDGEEQIPLIGEPACGRGDMAMVLERNGFDVLASDLQDTGYGEPFRDFLKIDPKAGDHYEIDGLMTNPPFAVAHHFIRHAVKRLRVPVVAMLLKSNYWNAKGRLKLWDECTPTGFFPMTWRLAFLEQERGKSPLMDCDWWVWVQGEPKLPWRPLEKPQDVPRIVYPRSVLEKDNLYARAELTRLLEKINA